MIMESGHLNTNSNRLLSFPLLEVQKPLIWFPAHALIYFSHIAETREHYNLTVNESTEA